MNGEAGPIDHFCFHSRGSLDRRRQHFPPRLLRSEPRPNSARACRQLQPQQPGPPLRRSARAGYAVRIDRADKARGWLLSDRVDSGRRSHAATARRGGADFANAAGSARAPAAANRRRRGWRSAGRRAGASKAFVPPARTRRYHQKRLARLRPLRLVVRETEFCGQRLAGDFSRRMRENGRNSVRRPRHASLTDRNCEGFCRPGNRVGLPVLYGGGCRDRTDGHRSWASLRNEAAHRGFSARNDFRSECRSRSRANQGANSESLVAVSLDAPRFRPAPERWS